jgi:acyl-CoA thioesterase-1
VLADGSYRRSATRLILRRTGTTLAWAALVIGSLLTFPSSIPWMIAVWLLVHTTALSHHRAGWSPLAVCLAIVVVKRIDWPPALWVLLVVMVTATGLSFGRGRTDRLPRVSRWWAVAALWAAWAPVAVLWCPIARRSSEFVAGNSAPVLCIGDSLTSGVPPYGGYPPELAKLLRVPVVDLGEAGITAEQGTRLIPKIREARPLVVVIELGGHDYLRGRSRSETKASMEEIIAAAREAGAEVILQEIPRGFMTDPFAGLEREIAREHALPLVPDTPIRQFVLWSPIAPPGKWLPPSQHLSDDGLHPNAAGNRHLAGWVARALVRRLGPSVLATQDGE